MGAEIRRLQLPRHSHSGWWIWPKNGGNGSRWFYVNLVKMETAAEEGGKRTGRIQLEHSGTSSLCLGITHSCDKIHALFVRQPSAPESCKKMGRRRWKSKSVGMPDADILRRGTKRRAQQKDSSRSSDVCGQGKSTSRRTCKWRSRHPSRQDYSKKWCSHGMASQDKSSSLHIARASPERRYCLYLLNFYHFTYTFSHAHTEAHAHKHTCTISTQEEWQQPGTGAWLSGRKVLFETLHTQKKRYQNKPIFTNPKKRFEHIELPTKLLDYFLRSSNLKAK